MERIKVHLMRNDMQVPGVKPLRHLPALYNHSVTAASQLTAASGNDPTLPACNSSFRHGTHRIIAVIGQHHGDLPLSSCHSTNIGIMRVDQGHAREPSPDLINTRGI